MNFALLTCCCTGFRCAEKI